MILHKETFKRFGYWPKDLTTKSNKFILVKCDICDKQLLRMMVKQTRATQFFKKEYSLCSQCRSDRARESSLKSKSNKRSTLFNLHKNNIVTPKDFLLASKFIVGNKGAILFRGSPITMENTYPILAPMGVRVHPKNTVELRDILLKWFLDQNNRFIHSVLNLYFETRKIRKHNTSWYLSLDDIFVRAGLHKLNFKYEDCRVKGRDKSVRITYGSFFIDGQWIHIG